MRVLDIDQNTEEWMEYRKGKSGGSSFGKIYRVNGRTNDETLKEQFFVMLAERVARPMTPNDYMDRVPEGVPFSWAVRGQILEPEAAKCFSVKYNKKLDDGKVWVDDDDPSSYVSPDRVITSPDGVIREAVEIKCLSSEKVLKVWYDKRHLEKDKSDFWALPSNEYKSQVIKYFMVNDDLEKLYWVLYTDLIPKLELQVLTIRREDVAKFIVDARVVENYYLKELENCEKLLD